MHTLSTFISRLTGEAFPHWAKTRCNLSLQYKWNSKGVTRIRTKNKRWCIDSTEHPTHCRRWKQFVSYRTLQLCVCRWFTDIFLLFNEARLRSSSAPSSTTTFQHTLYYFKLTLNIRPSVNNLLRFINTAPIVSCQASTCDSRVRCEVFLITPHDLW